jgi:hypothetical protein
MHRVGLIVPHGFQLLSLAPLTAFEMTGFGLAKPPPADSLYDLHLEQASRPSEAMSVRQRMGALSSVVSIKTNNFYGV